MCGNILYQVSCNLNVPVCLFCTEMANKVQEEQEEVESNVNLNIQSHVSPSDSVPDGHSSDQSQSDDPPPDETLADKSPEHVPADYLTWNGTNMTVRKNFLKFTSQ